MERAYYPYPEKVYSRRVVYVLVGILIVAIAAIIAAVYFYQSLQANFQNLQIMYGKDKQETVDQDTELLLGMMNKLAEVSEEKALKTGIQVFSSMQAIFSELAKNRDIEDHKRKLCLDPKTKSVFAETSPNVQRTYAKVCGLYNELIKSHRSLAAGEIGINAYQAVVNKLVQALVELANTISSDP